MLHINLLPKIGWRAVPVLVLMLCLPILLTQTSGNCNKTSAVANQTVENANPESDLLLVQLTGDAERQRVDDLMDEVKGEVVNTIKTGSTLTVLVVKVDKDKISEVERKLRKSKDIAYISRNSKCHLRSVPNPDDPFYATQWNLSVEQFNGARSFLNSEPSAVYMMYLDTGSTLINSDGMVNIYQYDFSDANGGPGALEANHDLGIDHGTMTTSCAAAATDNFIGMAGAANLEGEKINISMYRISADGESAGLVNIISALSSICNNPNTHAGPVNLSFGSSPASPGGSLNNNSLIQTYAYLLRQRGCMLILAAGNDGLYDPSPEQYARRVAAIGPDGQLASFSDYGPFNTAASGVNVPVYDSTGAVASEVVASGTSFAAPMYSSAIALVMSVLPQPATAAYADQIIAQTANVTLQGFVVPNLEAAVTLVVTGSLPPPPPPPAPPPPAPSHHSSPPPAHHHTPVAPHHGSPPPSGHSHAPAAPHQHNVPVPHHHGAG